MILVNKTRLVTQTKLGDIYKGGDWLKMDCMLLARTHKQLI